MALSPRMSGRRKSKFCGGGPEIVRSRVRTPDMLGGEESRGSLVLARIPLLLQFLVEERLNALTFSVGFRSPKQVAIVPNVLSADKAFHCGALRTLPKVNQTSRLR